ncbi:MAG TPA: YpdA family putative bacillithiol disulfide reductase [Candidatus Acidoferrales bacterium]|nr:YpdA family putative bacillithiol disulfide reductase [Candidatus Acidoferrales bacterium]
MTTYDIVCVGAGPTGLACAMDAKRAGMRALVIDKGCLCNSIYHYPVNMVFFTTPELLEIGDLPLVCGGEKPTRAEALKYYRKGTEHYALELRLFEKVLRVDGHAGAFTVVTQTESGNEERYSAKNVVVATGYYDLPNDMGVPGERQPHVSHYYTEPHEFWSQDVVVIGGKNSSVEAALDLWRNGARVTLVVRGKELGTSIKYWVRPDIENRIKAGQIAAVFGVKIKEIVRDGVMVENGGGARLVPGKQVFALTGYHPDYEFIEGLGVRLDPESRRPALDPNTLESNVPGIYLAGVVVAGKNTNEIFIENGRFHGKQIMEAVARK